MGSYTSIPVGALQEDIENLAQPLYASPQAFKVSFDTKRKPYSVEILL